MEDEGSMGDKTLAIVFSQWVHDAKDREVKVAGTHVRAGPHLRRLGLTMTVSYTLGRTAPSCTGGSGRASPSCAESRDAHGPV